MILSPAVGLVLAVTGYLVAPAILWAARRSLAGGPVGDWWPALGPMRCASAAVLGIIGLLVGVSFDLLPWVVFGGAALLLGVTDLNAHRLPNAAVGLFTGAAVVSLGAAAAVAQDGGRLATSLLAGAVAFAALGVLALAHPAGLGLGDVKLAFPLGMYLGWLGWAAVPVGLFAGFLLGAVAAVLLAIVRRTGPSTRVALGPYLFGGVAVCLLLAPA